MSFCLSLERVYVQKVFILRRNFTKNLNKIECKDLPTKKTKTIDFSLCIICQATKPKLKLSSPSIESYSKLLNKIELRQANGDSTYRDIIYNLKPVTYDQLTNKFQAKWHLQCYKDVTNQINIDRLVKRDETLKQTSNVKAFLNVKSGRTAK